MAILLDGIALNPNLQWSDEFDWSPVEQGTEHSLTGALIVDEGVKAAGQPVTLQSGADFGEVSLSTLQALQALLTAGRVMSLNFHGRLMDVMWRHSDKAIEAKPVMEFNAYGPDSLWFISLRLMRV